MRALGRIVVALMVAAAGVVGAAYLLPHEGEARAVVTIAAPPSAIYAVAADLGRFSDWSPWPEFGPAAQTIIGGPAGAVGQTLSWSSEDPALGAGALTIVALDPEERVAAEIDFGGPARAGSVLAIVPAGAGSRVEWAFAADLGANPLSRYAWVLSGARATLEVQLADGLARLAVLAQRAAAVSLAPPAIVAGPLPPATVTPPLVSSPVLLPPSLTPFAPSSSLGP